MLLPPSVEEWVPEEHLARVVVEAVDALDLAGIVGSYNVDGMGGAAFADVFAQVLDLCRRAGLGKAGIIALDGTKLKGNAALEQNRSLKKSTKELAQEAEIKAMAEAVRYGKGRRKNELPKGPRRQEERRGRLLEAKRQLEDEQRREAETQAAKIEVRAQEERQTGRKKRGQDGGCGGGRRNRKGSRRRRLPQRGEPE